MKQIASCFALAAALCVPSSGAAAGGQLRAWGSMYTDLGAYHYHHGDSPDTAAFAGLSRLTLNLQGARIGMGKVEGSLDLTMPYGENARVLAQTLPGGMVALFSDVGAPVLLDLRKLYLSFYLPFADVSLGRQIVNFGKGLVFSPIDVFSTVELTDLAFRRRGSDVAEVRVPFGDLAGADILVEFPVFVDDYASALKLFATLWDYDFSLVGIYKHQAGAAGEAVAGGAFKGDAGLGLCGEAVGHFPVSGGGQYFEGMLGFDYSIHARWFFSAEYLHSGAPVSAATLWGKHNAVASGQVALNDLMNLSVSLLYGWRGPGEHTGMGTLQYFYNVLQNVDLTAYVRGFLNGDDRSVVLPDAQYAVRFLVKF